MDLQALKTALVVRVKADYDLVTGYGLQQARDRAVEANVFNRRRFQFNR